MTEFDKMIQLLELSWVIRSQVVPCLVGPPGIGKTAAVMQHAAKHGSKVVKIVASRCVPSETVGMTMPDHKNRGMVIYNSMQLSSLKDGDILFLDELLEADQFVLSTLLTVIESREMADGTPLPDIQIIAATNDTISPEQLKGNIRQRFMFYRFSLSTIQTKRYIFEQTGLEIDNDVIKMLCADGSDYNFLTPRSLTKLCLWVNSVPSNQLDILAGVINNMWNSTIGTDIVSARRNRDFRLRSPERQVRDAVMQMAENNDIPHYLIDEFKDCSLSEMYETLQSLDEWKEIKAKLAAMEIVEPEDEDDKVSIDF